MFHLPISTLTNDANDNGEPLCLSRPDGAAEELQVFDELAASLAKDLLLLQHGRSRSESGGVDRPETVVFPGSAELFDVATTHLSLDGTKQGFLVRLFSNDGATQRSISADDLRSRHPKTGEILDLDGEGDQKGETSSSDGMVEHHKAESRRPTARPTRIEKKGRYGYAVEYSDGATIIYSMLSISKAAGASVAR